MSVVATAAMSAALPGIENGEARLVAEARAGDPQAFAALVRRHERRVFRLAGRFFPLREDVEEAAQETFLLAWRKLESYRAEAPFESWITRICLNHCCQRLRRKSPPRESFDVETAATPAPDPATRVEVERLLAGLSAEDRFVLLLLEGEGWSVAEIADRLGWGASKVKVRAHRARRRLRRLLEERR